MDISDPDNEKRYDALFNNMTEGFALNEIICDEKGEPYDYRFLDVNPAFERLTGLNREDVIGKTFKDVLPNDDPRWVKEFGAVALTGKSVQFENYSLALGRYYNVYSYCPSPSQFAVIFTDITERKRTGEENQRLFSAIQAEKDRLSALINSMDVEIWFADTQKKFTMANPSALREFQLDSSGEIDVEEFAASIGVYRADGSLRPIEENPALRALHGEVIRNLEEIVRTPATGELRYRIVSSTPVRDRNGNIIGSVSAVRDITDLKRSEEVSHETKEYLENLLNYANAPIIVWDPFFRIVRFNHAFEKLTGYKVDEVLGKELDLLFPANSKDSSMSLIKSTLLGERWDAVEIPISNADGSIRTLLWNSANIYDKDRKTVLATIAQGQDITDRKQMETKLEQMVQELQETRDYLENLINYANAPIIVWDSSFGVTRFNNAFEKLTGLIAAEVLGKQLDSLFPNGSKKDSMNLIQSTLAGERWEAVEIPILRKDGSTRIALWNSANILSQSGTEVVATIAQGQDITERKRMETELEQMVLERTAELSLAKEALEITNETLRVEIEEHKQLELDLLKARDAAEKAARAKSTFMANMSHEIRTPMNSVIGMTSLLLDEDLNPEQRDFVETIRTGGEALLSIINDILDFSRLEREKAELEYQPLHLFSTIEEALDLVAAKAAEKKLNLAYIIDKITPNTIIGDPTRLRQILSILLDNAVKFTGNGEILVSVSSSLSDSQYEVHFAVKDTGIGMNPAKMDHLFESFSQLDDSISTKYGGAGLGLAISKKLVDLMGGKIWAESNIGKGSTFHFTILTKAVSVKPKLAQIEPKLKGKRILIVENNKTIRRILGHQARDWGMMPTTVGSSREALKLLQGEDSFDIAIIEKDLPELDGLALAREIRRYNKPMPLLMLTFVGRGIESELFAATLIKPIKPTQLYNILIDTLTPQSITEPVSAPEAISEPGTMRILLAEDNLSSQNVTLQMLKKLGYRSDVVANGREVLDALGRQRYDLILMDVRMPEMNGLEATRIIRQRWPAKGPVIIAITAYGLEGDRERCLAAGMDDYLSKPVQLDDLAKMLRKYTSAQTSKKASSRGREKHL